MKPCRSLLLVGSCQSMVVAAWPSSVAAVATASIQGAEGLTRQLRKAR